MDQKDILTIITMAHKTQNALSLYQKEEIVLCMENQNLLHVGILIPAKATMVEYFPLYGGTEKIQFVVDTGYAKDHKMLFRNYLLDVSSALQFFFLKITHSDFVDSGEKGEPRFPESTSFRGSYFLT
uniref:Uncharacterized protein n=1 Tax=Salix viminalis TaxID=40686 RepID=A0A6N2LSL1_SALVM